MNSYSKFPTSSKNVSRTFEKISQYRFKFVDGASPTPHCHFQCSLLPFHKKLIYGPIQRSIMFRKQPLFLFTKVRTTLQDPVPVTEVNDIQPWFALVEVHYWVAENSKWLEPETTKEAWKAMQLSKRGKEEKRKADYILRIQLQWLA